VAAAPAPVPAVHKGVPPSALRYLVPPPISLPVASRRLGEQGSVVLRVVVDARGAPRQVVLLRSSGYARLDDDALAAMKRARFHPCTDNGAPIECESSAQLVYELEN
jgi:protein TonB